MVRAGLLAGSTPSGQVAPERQLQVKLSVVGPGKLLLSLYISIMIIIITIIIYCYYCYYYSLEYA